jgi:hypothetical protein
MIPGEREALTRALESAKLLPRPWRARSSCPGRAPPESAKLMPGGAGEDRKRSRSPAKLSLTRLKVAEHTADNLLLVRCSEQHQQPFKTPSVTSK